MTKINRKIFLTLVLVLLSVDIATACTSVIVSGKITRDGRPLIFKNRDTYNLDNVSVLVQGEKYRYLAIVAAKDTTQKCVWSGHNEKGFAILNTAAYNLNCDCKEDESNENDGCIMRRALEICATLADFEHFLDTIPRPIHANSNFGVMDAEGGCAYYETGNKGYKKYDVNDPNVAPYGYLVRTNHAMSGDRSLDKGVERYLAISKFMNKEGCCGKIDYKYLLTTIPRYLVHGLTDINLYDFEPEDNKQPKFFPFRDFIPRYQTASTVLIQGVKKGENPLLTISWTIVGSPLTTVAVPLVISKSGVLPKLVTRNDKNYSALCHAGLELKKRLFPLERGSITDYIDLSQLINKKGTGILQLITPIEDRVIDMSYGVIESMRNGELSDRKLKEYYEWVDNYIKKQYNEVFNINIDKL